MKLFFIRSQDFEAETKRLTAGKGVDVVYDSVGKTTFEKGLNVLRPRGLMALFGGQAARRPNRSDNAYAKGIAVCYAPDAEKLHRDA